MQTDGRIVQGGLEPEVGSARASATGGVFSALTVMEAVPDCCSLSVTVNLTLYMPERWYVCSDVGPIAEVSSPKSHRYELIDPSSS